MVTSRLLRTLFGLLIVSVLALGCGPKSAVRDLGPLGGTGKADFTGFEFSLPTIDKNGSLQLTFSATGAFKVELSQPDVASSKRATVRLLIDDGARDEETPSSKSPSIAWEPDGNASIGYTLTIKNRSHSRVLEAYLVIKSTGPVEEPDEPFAAPTERRTLANKLPFAVGATKVAVAFFDADSTLRISKTGKKTPNGPEDVMLLPGVATGLNKAMAEGKLIAVVSNQGGVHWGHVSLADAEAAVAKAAELLQAKGAQVHYFDFAPEYDDFRKPGTGMADHLETVLGGVAIDWDESMMVGDAGWKRNVDTEPDGTPGDDFSNSDRGFAEALGIPFFHPRDYFGWAALGLRNFHKKAEVDDFLADNPDFGD